MTPRPQQLGVSRTVAWAPTHDTGRNRGPDPGALFSAGRQWTPLGLVALGHTISVNLATGGLVISVNDLSIAYQTLPLQVSRLIDLQEQHSQEAFLEGHPNVDPRFHFFANWQLFTETQVTPTWNHALPELLVNDGDGEGTLFYRHSADFDINQRDGGGMESRIRAYGIPGRTLSEVSWQFQEFDSLLRSIRGPFAILPGRFLAETMVDSVDLDMWRFEPITGMAYQYTSKFAYQQLIDTDDMRVVSVPSIWTLAVDPLGHSLSFHPVEKSPPYRTYLVEDGSARSLRLELDDFVSYLDGNNPGGKVKMYVISRTIDLTRNKQNVVEYKYVANRLAEVHYPGNAGRPARVVKYNYDAMGHLVSITDPVGDSFTFEYQEDPFDSDDRLIPRLKVTKIADEEGNSIAYKYDHPHHKVTVTFAGADGDVRSGVFEYQEDSDDTGQRFITSQTIQVTQGYSGNQQVRTLQTYSDDGRYRLIQFTDALGGKQRFEYNDFNQITAVTDQLGHRRDFTHDIRQTPIPSHPNRYDLIKSSEQNADLSGNIFTVETSATFLNYTASTSDDPADSSQSTHRVETRKDELGHVSTYEYDDGGNTNPLSPTTLIDPLGKKRLWSYSSSGGVLSETDPTGTTWKWSYNAQGRRVSATDANGFVRYWVYDSGTGWLTDSTDALGNAPGDPAHSEHYDWNDAGQLVRQRDAVGALTEYAYFRNKRIRSITGHDPAARTTSFDYDAAGLLASIRDAQGHATIFRYDEAARLYETFRDKPQNPALQFVMDQAGQVTKLTDRNKSTIEYDYDPLGRITNIREPNWPASNPVNQGKTVAIKYDFLGHRLEVVDSQLPLSTRYFYDAVGNQTKRIDSFGFILNYAYDSRNDLVNLYDTVGEIDLRFERDDAGRLSAVRDSKKFDPSRQFRYFWTAGNLKDNLYRIELDSSGTFTRCDYDANRMLTEISHENASGQLLTFTYSYRPDGLLATVSGDHNAAYDFDDMKQLTRESDVSVQSQYDPAGNRLWRASQQVPVSKQNVYDADNQLLSCPLDAIDFTYDADGSRLTRTDSVGTAAYTYDAVNRLMRVEFPKFPSRSVNYLYDIDGRLLERSFTDATGKLTVQRFRHANRSILAIVDDKKNLTALFTRDDQGRLLRSRGPVKVTSKPSTDPYSLFYLLDGFLSVARLVEWNGTVAFSADYDAWGQSNVTGKLSDRNPFGYRGGWNDRETGILNFGIRWYDPQIGRWLTQDPILSHLITGREDPAPAHKEITNLYLYVRNNPLTYFDPDGLYPSLPKGWWTPPGWKGGLKWTMGPDGKLRDPQGNKWRFHPEDDQHNDHWDFEDKRGKKRLDKAGKDMGEDAFKPEEPKEEAKDEDKSEDGESSERRAAEAVVAGGVAIGAGIVLWEVGKWIVAIALAPETFGGSVAAAALTP